MTDLVALVHVFDQVDLLEPFVAWYADMGVRRIVVQDMGSTDGSRDALDRLSRHYPLDWNALDDLDLRNHAKGNTGDAMAERARDRYAPDWMLMCDADEFLCLDEGGLDDLLLEADGRGATTLSIPCFNMTGPPPTADDPALRALTTRIVRPYQESREEQLAREIPVPFVFVRHPPKSISRAAAFADYKPGSHGSNVRWGSEWLVEGAHFKHYPMRSFPEFERKVANVESFLAVNHHLPEWWGWHWRRWIDLARRGGLRADYDRQFLDRAGQLALVADGTCQVDGGVADWLDRRGGGDVPKTARGLTAAEGRAARLAWLETENASLRSRLDALTAAGGEATVARLQARVAFLSERLGEAERRSRPA